jgi:[ribosomal protein S5]-alanine N-acetyltransferase
MDAPTLNTARLVLRRLRADEADAIALFAVLSDPEVMIWWSSGPHESLAETREYLARNAADEQDWLCWAITVGDDVALGWVILMDRRPGVGEIGYILHRDQWGSGIAREAVSRVIAYGFDDLGFRRILPTPIRKMSDRSLCWNASGSNMRGGFAMNGKRISASAIR